MKYTGPVAALFVALALLAPPAAAQEAPSDAVSVGAPSPGIAFAWSLLVPGSGHRYVHGDWDGWASVFAVAEAGLWAGLFGVARHRDHLVESYRTLASLHAGVNPDGKSRDFYLNVATYPSSEAYTDAQLRSRNWGQVDYAADPSYQWEWDSEERFRLFRETREKSESLRRRRTFIVTTLVANRLIAGMSAIRSAQRAGPSRTELSLAPRGAEAPLVRFIYRFR